jgi:hypothetical protein
MANMFTNAAVIPAKESAPSKAKNRLQIEIEGIKMYGLLVAAEKAIVGLKETWKTVVTPEALDQFALDGGALGRKPENFQAFEPGSVKYKAMCILGKRSSASKLDDQEQSVMRAAGIETQVVEDRPETFIFNPKYATDGALLEKIAAAISGIDGVPADLIMKQESTKKVVTTEKSLDQVFALKTPDGKPDVARIKNLMSIAGTFSLKPTVDDFDLSATLEEIRQTIVADEDAAAKETA